MRTRAPATILVVDDDEEVRNIAVGALCEIGFQVIEASDVAEAMMVLERGERIDLVLSDVVMPGEMNGYDLAARVTEEFPGTACCWSPALRRAPRASGPS